MGGLLQEVWAAGSRVAVCALSARAVRPEPDGIASVADAGRWRPAGGILTHLMGVGVNFSD